MAFKELTSNETRYPKYSEFSKGDVIVQGVYSGTQEGKFGIQHIFDTETGKVVLGKAGHLDYWLEQVETGSTVQVVYGGSEIMKKGAYAGKPAHRFSVLVDDGSPIDETAPF